MYKYHVIVPLEKGDVMGKKIVFGFLFTMVTIAIIVAYQNEIVTAASIAFGIAVAGIAVKLLLRRSKRKQQHGGHTVINHYHGHYDR
jgi:uncharacterized membrane protein